MANANTFEMKVAVKGYVYYEMWLSSYMRDNNIAPSEEIKEEVKKICRRLARNMLLNPNFLDSEGG